MGQPLLDSGALGVPHELGGAGGGLLHPGGVGRYLGWLEVSHVDAFVSSQLLDSGPDALDVGVHGLRGGGLAR
jgi:hypothetical protein